MLNHLLTVNDEQKKKKMYFCTHSPKNRLIWKELN
jgi:hypothetical protein